MTIESLTLPDGTEMPRLGVGTWYMGDRASERAREADVLRLALDSGVRLIDTAEMYGEGGAESVIGDALKGRRDDAFLVSKVYPHNAAGPRLHAACESSLKRMGVERIDLYLLHWRGQFPLEETIAGFERLRAAGKIGAWGVSNFDDEDLDDLAAAGGRACQVNQILYSLARREADWSVLGRSRKAEMGVMAYSPLDQGRLLRSNTLKRIAEGAGTTPACLAIAWLLTRPGVIAIPKSASPAHLRENLAGADLRLDDATRAALEQAFPPPARPTQLGII